MDCPHIKSQTNSEFLRAFNQRVTDRRIPISGSIALTHHCNLRCRHCYLPQSQRTTGLTNEWDAAQFCAFLDQIAEAGCLFLLLTGGEPLTHPGFAEIYSHAKNNGMLISLFTNATCLTPAHIKLFQHNPPHSIEVSIYGADARIYEQMTGIKDSFQACCHGLDLLAEAKLPLSIKTVLTTLNQHQLQDMRDLAAHYQADFRFDSAILSRFDGDPAPTALRVPAATAVAEEFRDENRARHWSEYARPRRGRPASDRLYLCGAGATVFHLSPNGILTPCLLAPEPCADLNTCTFRHAWEQVIPAIRERRINSESPCATCERRSLCGFCPPFCALDPESTHGASGPSPYLCALGHKREQEIQHFLARESTKNAAKN